ncbi:sulfatase family protein [Thalassoroseus pseudoceratinae]|uniref:sulfatase family protein n=1 Tax=Thalassoroseus pseudoceratinae TaxID=2713176 RepID=UPI0014204E2C|nr:sulfatase [Thalassoroseus pseudoceratinae]
MKRLHLFRLLLGLTVGILPSMRILAADRPNIVMIISDDQAWGDYGFMGHEHIETPHLDRLAKGSLTFTRGYVPDSLCRPSLATIVTGLYPHQHGIVGNDPPPPADLSNAPKGRQRQDPRYLERRNKYIEHIDDDPTLAGILAKQGYLSHQSGKWWEGHFSRGGFTHGMTHGDRTRGGRHGDKGLTIGRQGLEPIADFLTMTEKEDKPFFVYYAPFLPHTPHNPPKRLLDKYREKTPHLPVAKYWAMCEWFDETCGELLGMLDDRGLTENTIVVYVTDNGWINRTDRSAYAERSKRSRYDGGLRTPIMVRWPNKVTPKMDREHAVSSIDLVPTLLAALDLPKTEEMEGINLLDEKAVAERDAIFGEILEHDIRHMTDPAASLLHRWTISDQWKLIVPNDKLRPNDVVELYDLDADPYEKKNLADERKEIVTRLTQKLNQWWNPSAEHQE